MKNFNELNAFNSTIIEWEGIELRTTQDPYLNNDEYTAIAVDSKNNEYEITWEINHPDFENLEDESEACDWENPIKVVRL